MKKSLFILFLLFLPWQLRAFSIQGDVSAFRPTSKILREIYGNFWVDYKLEMEGQVAQCHWFWKKVSVFGDISYLGKHGKSIGGHNKTWIRIIPVSLGVKWTEKMTDRSRFYVGAGPRYFFLHIHDHLKGVKQKINKNGLGALIITGFNVDLWKGLYLDLFASYSFKHFSKPSTPKNVQGHSLQVGGLDVGAGLGWAF